MFLIASVGAGGLALYKDLRNGDGHSQRKQSCRSKNASDLFPSSKFLVFAVQYANLGYWECWFHWFSFGGKLTANEKNETIKTNVI
ncbi:hypothetical protein C4D60_Mb07t18790 [Musa balbisiana]|uniref:Uncharacterized protein n=1 Tax=Musa balbisiana TaxID=52838 RepID=A0A4S8JIT6_MUSBA|nr:hypothetical protein C4D60_Mb07t18790 [Musa balbisiana]